MWTITIILVYFKHSPTSSTWYQLQTHKNDLISNPVCTEHYLDNLTKIVHTSKPSENIINAKIPNSSTIASRNQAHIALQNLSSEEKHAEIFSNLHSSLVSIGQLCEYECIVTFDNHRVIVSKNKDKIIEGYWEPNWTISSEIRQRK